MNKWNKKNIGSIILYKSQYGGENKEVAIYDVNVDLPNTIEIVDHPLALNSIISRDSLGLKKEDEVEHEILLKKVGDWVYVGEVSEDVKEQFKKFSKTRRDLSDSF